MDEKIQVLKMIAEVLNKHDVTWNVGASCMLYLRGIVTTFEDIDIMISENDINTVRNLFKDQKQQEKYPNNQYKTKHFIEYLIDGVDIDIMSGFIIVNNQEDYYFPLSNKEMDTILLDDIKIYLEDVEVWHRYYQLMNRLDKVRIIENYLHQYKQRGE